MTITTHETLWPITKGLTDLSVDEDVEDNQKNKGYIAVDKQVKVNEINLDV